MSDATKKLLWNGLLCISLLGAGACSRVDLESKTAASSSDNESDEADQPEQISGAFLVCGPADPEIADSYATGQKLLGCAPVEGPEYKPIRSCQNWTQIKLQYANQIEEVTKPILGIDHSFWQFFADIRRSDALTQLSIDARCDNQDMNLIANRFDYKPLPEQLDTSVNRRIESNDKAAPQQQIEMQQAPAYLIFVTSQQYHANLGYVGFDSACQKAADDAANQNATLKGVAFEALLSGRGQANRATQMLTSGTLVRNLNKELVSSSDSDIWQRGAAFPVAYNEDGDKLAASEDPTVWTGAKFNGIYVPKVTPGLFNLVDGACTAWGSRRNADSAYAGNANQAGPQWFELPNLRSCDQKARLYCISKEPVNSP